MNGIPSPELDSNSGSLTPCAMDSSGGLGAVNDYSKYIPPNNDTYVSLKKQTETADHYFNLVMEKWKSFGPFKDDDNKIWQKLWKHFETADILFKQSKSFRRSLKTALMNISKGNVFTILKDIRDNLKSHPTSIVNNSVDDIERTASPSQKQDQDQSATKRKLSRIEARMKVVSKKIKEVEEQEVDLDDEVNSSYLLWNRLKEQYLKLDRMYCKLAQCSRKVGRASEKKFKYEGSRYPEINKKISIWVDKTKTFPDFTDIVNLVRKASSESNLLLKSSAIHAEAAEIFKDVGSSLKRRRLTDDLDSLYGYGDSTNSDPAENDPELSSQLESNSKLAKESFHKVFDLYVEKQNELAQKGINLEANSSDESENGDDSSVESHESATVELDSIKNSLEKAEDCESPKMVSDKSFNSCEKENISSDTLTLPKTERVTNDLDSFKQSNKRKAEIKLENSNKICRSISPELVCLD